MRLLRTIVATFEDRGSKLVVIGATALAVRGVSRATLDLDLLTTDRGVLRQKVWSDVRTSGATVDIRHGDINDPLVGVIRIQDSDDRPIDIIVGEAPWQDRILDEARPAVVKGMEIPVATEIGLILLKLYAGGPQDVWDIQQLILASSNAQELIRAVTDRLTNLPSRCRKLWHRVQSDDQ